MAEIILRGTLVYLFLFCFLRFLRRETGVIGISDLLVVVLIADAAQNTMSSDYKSVTDGAILVATIIGWDYVLDWQGTGSRGFSASCGQPLCSWSRMGASSGGICNGN